MDIAFLLSSFVYFGILIFVGVWFSYRQKKAADFMVGDRSVNYWVTAIATHATDMSTWLFMALPGLVYRSGLFTAGWTAIGLTFCMYLTWKFIAPSVRKATERTNAPTLFSYFERHFNDPTGALRIVSSLIALVFFTFYIASGIVGLGRTIEVIFPISYHLGIGIGTVVVAGYTLLGGFMAIAWNDFLQGLFVLFVLLFVPFYAFSEVGGVANVLSFAQSKGLSLSLFPDYSLSTFVTILLTAFGWGIGYFGAPHIIVNFMGIDDASNIKKSQYMGLTWQVLTMVSAIAVGLIGLTYFADGGLVSSELVFVTMVKSMFPGMLAGFMLCAILAAAITTMDSQILVSASTIAQDIYKKIFNERVSPKKLLKVTRLAGIGVTAASFAIAWNNDNSILDLVFYAWSGLGASFGPVLIASFYSRYITWQGALAGIISGGLTAGVWRFLQVPPAAPLIPGYIVSFVCMYGLSFLTQKK